MVLEPVAQCPVLADEPPIIDQVGILVELLGCLIMRVQVVLKTAQVALADPCGRCPALLFALPGGPLMPDRRTGIGSDGLRRILVVIQPVAGGGVTTHEAAILYPLPVPIELPAPFP